MRERVGCRRRTNASLAAFLVALVALAVSAPAQADDCPFADAQPGQASQDQLASATFCLLNQQRTAYGLRQLRASRPLTTTARKYSAYMVSDEHFAHQDEDGHNVVYRVLQTDPSIANRWDEIGENLGWGTYGMATPRAMVQGWMNSPGHRENILYPKYDEVGVGVVDGAPEPGKSNALTYATVFGKISPPKHAKPHKRARRSCKRVTKRAKAKKAKRAHTARSCESRARAAHRKA